MPLTLPAFLQLLGTCAPLVAQHPTLRDLAIAQAKVESGFNPTAISPPSKKDGLSDYGIMQFHFPNLAPYGMDTTTALDPCQNLRAYQAFLTVISRYNCGGPTCGFDNGYVENVETTRLGVKLTGTPTTPAPLPACSDAEHIAWLNCHATNSSWHTSYNLTGGTPR